MASYSAPLQSTNDYICMLKLPRIMLVDSFATTWAFISIWTVAATATVDYSRVVFVINSQPNPHHAAIAEETAARIKASLSSSGVEGPHHVYSAAHEDFLPLHGAWTYFPLIEAVARELADVADWFVFLEESSDVNLDELSGVLSSQSPDDDVFVGHALADLDSVIQHHYARPGEVKFPQTDAGFVLSRAVVERVREEFDSMSKSQSSKFPKDFSIDPAYELARMLGHLFDGDGVRALTIKNDTRLCLGEDAGCAVHPRKRPGCEAEDIADLASSTLFAVKTCKKFHEERLTVVGETWAKAALNVKYFSEEADPKFGTIVLPGVRNTERGHCGKTLAIMKFFNKHALEGGWKWLVIADDDTILGVNRYLKMLACYDPTEKIGEAMKTNVSRIRQRNDDFVSKLWGSATDTESRADDSATTIRPAAAEWCSARPSLRRSSTAATASAPATTRPTICTLARA